ncbi:Endonuclease/exonuclease/phosphatase [Apiospora aurea]|uniref:Endonuclease/exonuclease/phosphatase n=1 Tax=Apiospora aurea TaxID=335848 RepID=A0ABR1QH91_9PEZI
MLWEYEDELRIYGNNMDGVYAGDTVGQDHYAFNQRKQVWEKQKKPDPNQGRKKKKAKGGAAADGQQPCPFSKLALFSWNIDFMAPYAKARMDTALSTLENVTGSQKQQSSTADTATIIFLQECVDEDLKTIAANPWVRERFFLTDLDSSNWFTPGYGTTMLVDRRLPVVRLFREHFEVTSMARDAFCVDVSMAAQQQRNKPIRLCNTHLESLAGSLPLRPAQMRAVAELLKDGDVVAAGIVAGDFNAIQDFDRTLHDDNGLRDAYLEMGGQEDTEEGYTWGQQAKTATRRRFGCSRMDKVYYCPSSSSSSSSSDGGGGGNGDDKGDVLRLLRFEKFGVGVELPAAEKEARKGLVKLGYEKPWITDHLGIMAEFEVVAQRDEAS